MPKVHTPRHRGERGFTLLEMVISIVLIGILGAIGSQLLYSGFLTTARVNANNESSAAARYAIERLTRELREVANNSASYRITSAQPSSIVFQSSISRTGMDLPPQVPSASNPDPTWIEPTTIAFDAANKIVTLTRGSSPSQPASLASDVKSFGLTYYNARGSVTTNLGDIRSVRVDLGIQTVDSPEVRISSLIVLRN